ncbi:MAG: hypothetical protein B0A82_01930 [Alkalinema sp. CACIAM 70d]|nr:MAG: hypothetical protein B0A82_01930 [Alkalinema sp. CACIAM 70d]
MSNKRWFKVVFQWRGSVLPLVLPRSLLCGFVALMVAWIYQDFKPIALPLRDSLIPSIVLGLLLVFRTNTAYDRFWEGRKCWGTIIISTRNLARHIWVGVEEHSKVDRQEKIAALQLLPAFAIATRQHLRQEPMGMALAPYLLQEQLEMMGSSDNVPLEITFWLGGYLQTQYQKGHLNEHRLNVMTGHLDNLVGALSGCERILKTPMPLAYAIHLKQLLLIYCLVLPFQMVKDLGWLVAPVVIIISFTLLGIEEIGLEIENPFGKDANDLPLENFCATIERNVMDLTRFSSPHWSPMVWEDASVESLK